MKTKIAKWYSVLSPRPTVLVSTVSEEGVSNAAPFSFVMPVSMEPPIVAIASAGKRHTLKNIRQTRDFAVNIPSSSLLKEVWACSMPLAQNVSEIEEAGLTEVKSRAIKSPKIRECFASFECRLLSEHEAGDHFIVLGEVVDMDVDEAALAGGQFDPKVADPLMHVGGADFATVGRMITHKE